MAEIHAGDGFGPVRSRGGVKTLSTALGALTALAVGGAVLWWGWGLTTRDIDDIPVVRALDGPMKRRPADPGGMILDTTDLSINSMLAGEGAGEVALAPATETPAPEDVPVTRLGTAAPAADKPLGPFETPAAPAAPAIADKLKAQAAAREAAAAEAARQADREAAARIDALAALAASEAPAEDLLAPAEPVDPPDAGAAAPRMAPVSPIRPDASARAQAQDDAATQIAAAAAPKTLSPGDPAVQLGAYNSAEVAESQWARQLRRNEDLMRGHVHAVTTVKSGGRTLYRLRVGPLASRDAARNLCEALKARGDACNPVTVK